MTYTVSPSPLDVASEESDAGFKRTVLSLGDFVGAYPGGKIEVVARRLSGSDVFIKEVVVTRHGETKVRYRHLRFGCPSAKQKICMLWRDLKFGFWRSWRERGLGWSENWWQVPGGCYDRPSDACSRTSTWLCIVGAEYCEYAV